MSNRWKHSPTCIYNTSYHFIFCPKYRRKVLVGKIAERLQVLIQEKCQALDIEIGSMEVMPDHVHLFLHAKPMHAPHYIVGQIKGYSSRILREEFASLTRRLPCMWTRSYYVESIGHISQYTIEKYIADQKGQ